MYIDANEQFSDTKVEVFYTTDVIINNDHTDVGSSWIPFPRDLAYSGLTNEYLYNTDALVTIGTSLRVKIVLNMDLTTENSSDRAQIENLRLFLANS